MENHKDLSGLYLLIGALLGFFISLTIVNTIVIPQIYPAETELRGKPPIAETYGKVKVGLGTACISAAIGGFAGCKAYSLRQRGREATRNNSPSVQ